MAVNQRLSNTQVRAETGANVNEMDFAQASQILNSVVKQATGQTPLTPTTTGEFVSVAQTALKTGYDPILNAISQVLSRTIFSIRPYYRKFGGLMADSVRYGNHVRKLQSIDKDFGDDDRLVTCGESVDQQKVCCPEVVQTNFYGQFLYQKCITVFRDQLDVAFSGPGEFGQFVAMIMQNISDQIEQAHEATARFTLANFIAGKVAGDPTNVIHLVTEYNAATGGNYTSATIRNPANFAAFARWMIGRIKTLSDLLTERTVNYHTNLTDKPIPRHTPLARQKVYLSAALLNEIDANVLANTYHDNFLRIADHERVNFWQAVESPGAVSVTPTYMLPTGMLTTPADPVAVNNLMGVIFDEEAVGYTMVNEWSAPAPFNARGGYTTMYWHFTDRYWNDFTENGIVLLLD